MSEHLVRGIHFNYVIVEDQSQSPSREFFAGKLVLWQIKLHQVI